MSDLLAAAAAALGMPEDLVRRSAEARAAETGSSVDEILTAWGGGEAVAVTSSPAPEPPPSVEVSPEPPAPQPDVAPEIVIETPPAQTAPVAAAPPGTYRPPVLVAAPDKPGLIILGAIGLFLVVLLLGLVGPSVATDEPGARTSEIPYSQAAVDGQKVYASVGCAACHTQMVRPVVADVGLGAVTLNDTNQVIGDRRFGPDLSDVGTRMTSSQLESTVSGDTTAHPPHNLASKDMAALVAYLLESRNSGGEG
jgi:hypothetical protein